jgi:hypothetical protein
MGLDMYLEKTKRVLEERSENELLLMNLANNWLTYVADNESCTFEEYCGATEDLLEKVGGLDTVKKVAELVKPDLKTLGGANLGTPEGVKHIVFRSIWTEIGYWRKANHIHKWFVDCVQDGEDDCEKYEVTKSNLLDLKAVCEEVLSLKGKDEGKIEEILPTTSGFFFGGTEYDEYYFSDVEETIRIINNVLETTDFEKELVVYQSSW